MTNKTSNLFFSLPFPQIFFTLINALPFHQLLNFYHFKVKFNFSVMLLLIRAIIFPMSSALYLLWSSPSMCHYIWLLYISITNLSHVYKYYLLIILILKDRSYLEVFYKMRSPYFFMNNCLIEALWFGAELETLNHKPSFSS